MFKVFPFVLNDIRYGEAITKVSVNIERSDWSNEYHPRRVDQCETTTLNGGRPMFPCDTYGLNANNNKGCWSSEVWNLRRA